MHDNKYAHSAPLITIRVRIWYIVRGQNGHYCCYTLFMGMGLYVTLERSSVHAH